MQLILGDCLEKLKELSDNSVDSIVTDPPYGLSFMGKKWDYDVPSVAIWQEAIRVLKPGGHLLSFAGSRTYHRMAVNIEDAGFEIRDQIMWVYGSGFPKSHNIGKAVDKLQGNEREDLGEHPNARETLGDIQICKKNGSGRLTKGNSPWEGWGTALKPAHEPIVVARKPLSEKTVAKNVLKWGTGGLNIDECRVEHNEELKVGFMKTNREKGLNSTSYGGEKDNRTEDWSSSQGRFPANLIHDGSDEVVELFPGEGDKSAARFFYCAKASKKDRNEGLEGFEDKVATQRMNASKFRYEEGREPTPRAEQSVNKNNHPTVKPTKLMQYLVRLVTPKGGTVLDPFMGSGSTGKACVKEGFGFIGIEMDEDYLKIAKARIEHADR